MKMLLVAIALSAPLAVQAQCDPLSVSCLMQQSRQEKPLSPLDLSPSALPGMERDAERSQRDWDQRRMREAAAEDRARLDVLEAQQRDAEFRRALRLR